MQRSATANPTASVLLCLALLACHGGGHEDQKAKAPTAAEQAAARSVRTTQVALRQIEGGVEASGVLASREEAAVSAEVSGFRVARVLADVGQSVRAGQVLVELDDALLRAQIEQQTALVAQAEVAARQAQAQAQRVSGLEGTGALPAEQIEQRRFQAESAAAAAAAQRAALTDLQTRAGKMAVRAPVSGVVLERTVRPGELSGTGAGPMFRIARDGVVELQAQLSESLLATIRPGQAVQVTLPSGRLLSGAVRMVAPFVDPQTKLGVVYVRLPADRELRPGGFARARFNAAGTPVLSVRDTALRYDADGVSVMTVGPDNRVHEVPVRTGRRGAGYVELLSGPPPGALVLLGSSSFVLEGDLVNPVAEDAPAPSAGVPAAEARAKG